MKSVLWVVEGMEENGEWAFLSVKFSREMARRVAKFHRSMSYRTRIVKYVRAA